MSLQKFLYNLNEDNRIVEQCVYLLLSSEAPLNKYDISLLEYCKSWIDAGNELSDVDHGYKAFLTKCRNLAAIYAPYIVGNEEPKSERISTNKPFKRKRILPENLESIPGPGLKKVEEKFKYKGREITIVRSKVALYLKHFCIWLANET